MTTRSLVATLAKSTTRLASRFAVVSLCLISLAFAQGVQPGYPANQAGRVLASSYANWGAQALNAVSSGSQSMTLNICSFPVGSNNRFAPFGSIIALNVPIQIFDGANSESVTPTALTPPSAAGPSAINPINCGFTATFTYAHSVNVRLGSGDNGLVEAANDAVVLGSDVVTIDNYSGVTASTIASASVVGLPALMRLEYLKSDAPERWTIQPNTLTALATPTTLVAASTCSASTTVCNNASTGGTWANSAYHVGEVYVNMLGEMSTGSADASFTSAGTTSTIQFTSPAASTGAVGWLPAAGVSLAAEYVLPVTSANCILSTQVTQFPVCAMGSNAIMLGPVTTGPLRPVAGGLAAAYNPNPLSHTTFRWQPGNGPAGISYNYGPFTASPALTAGQAVVLGTVPLPYVGYLNFIHRTIRLTGKITLTPSTGGTDQILVSLGDITDFTTGTPKAVCTFTETTAITTAAQDQIFSCDLTVNATGATGSIMPGGFSILQVQGGTTAGAAAVESATAAITTDVLDWDLLYVVFLQTSAAESTTPPQLQNLHIEVL